ncbi:MAG TPA: acyltransferase [Edaphobacter sp.]|nr:acyltransferase [Edaphobacter sp.]
MAIGELPLSIHAPSHLTGGRLLQKHMPELDVLRGIAILMVVLYHGLYWSGAVSSSRIGTRFIQATVFGWLGVNLFFVLSGFLITGILLDTKGGQSYYRRFYQRRLLRILPAYLATIAVLLLLHHLTVGSAIIALGFLANYANTFTLSPNYGPFWSLSVEEQFYLLWPLLVVKVNLRIFTTISIAICLIEPILRYLTATGHLPLGPVRESTVLIADNLAFGALAAIFARSASGTRRNGVKLGLAAILIGLAILVAGLPFGILHRSNDFGAAFQPVPWNFFFTGLLLSFLGLRSSFFSGIYAASMRFLGHISYGLYLIHLLAFDAYAWLVLHLPSSVQAFLFGAFVRMFLAGMLAVLIAWLSRKFYEEPFLRMKFDSAPPKSHRLQPDFPNSAL